MPFAHRLLINYNFICCEKCNFSIVKISTAIELAIDSIGYCNTTTPPTNNTQNGSNIVCLCCRDSKNKSQSNQIPFNFCICIKYIVSNLARLARARCVRLCDWNETKKEEKNVRIAYQRWLNQFVAKQTETIIILHLYTVYRTMYKTYIQPKANCVYNTKRTHTHNTPMRWSFIQPTTKTHSAALPLMFMLICSHRSRKWSRKILRTRQLNQFVRRKKKKKIQIDQFV